MVLVLLIGDLHVPHRAVDIPDKFRELLKPGRIDTIICYGNLCNKEVEQYLRSVCQKLYITLGDQDEFEEDFPVRHQLVLNVQDLKIGAIHGHQVIPWGSIDALSIIGRDMDCDILVSGNTHIFKAYRHEGRLIINPGSATGAFTVYGDQSQNPNPSFVLMDVEGSKATLYVYQLIDDQLKVNQIEYTKSSIEDIASQSTEAQMEPVIT